METKKQESEKLSFWQLMNRAKIEIPIIQRDYAQGRKDKEEIRTNFLSALKKALLSKPTELDFVYGTIEDASFEPLDGQQRLTTLFLLHWYVCQNEGLLDSNLKSVLKKFTYQTRTSSREFTNKLVSNSITFTKNNSDISTIIKDASWFIRSWEKDPTIAGMLVMLDAIHVEFKHEQGLWSKLIDNNTPPISFQFIELNNFGLSDDLYIKMNARGKQLSPFENFKAGFINHINENNWDATKTITETFSHKIDTIWTDLFWNDSLAKKSFDTAFTNLLANTLLYAHALDKDKNKASDKEKKVQTIFNNPLNISPNDFNINGYERLHKYFDTYYKNKNKVKYKFPFWNLNENNKVLFEIIAEGYATYPQRVLFFAETEYLVNNSVIDDNFYNWMRFVRNIVLNSTIDSDTTFIGAINFINELTKGSKDIHTYLQNNKVQSSFAKEQLSEEINKAVLLDTKNKKAIFDLEDTNFCKGKLRFALYCAGFENTGDKLPVPELINIHHSISNYLNSENVSNTFRRAMFTIDDMCFYNYWTSWVYVLDLPKRCIINNLNDLKSIAYNEDFRHYLKELVCLLALKSPEDIITDFISNLKTPNTIPYWKLEIIKNKKLLDDYCKSHYIAVNATDTECYLLNVGKPRYEDSCTKIK